MEKALFTVSCTTCRARIAVRNKSAIGQILECPKCGSMVMISPPDGWTEEEPSPPPSVPPPVAQKTVASRPIDATVRTVEGRKGGGNGDSPARADTKTGPISSVPNKTPPSAAPETAEVAPPPVQVATAAMVISTATAAATVVSNVAAAGPVAADAPPPPAAAEVAAAGATEGPQAVAVRMGFSPLKVPEVVAGETYLSALTQSFAGQVAVMAVCGLLGLALVLGVWRFGFHRQPAPVEKTEETPKVDPTAANSGSQPKGAHEPIDRRWLPAQTAFVFDLWLSRLAKQPQFESTESLPGYWQRDAYSNVKLLQVALGLRYDQIRRLTWASTELGEMSKSCVVVIELEKGLDPAKFVPRGEEVKLPGDINAYRLRIVGWQRAVAVVDDRRIVAGSEELLRQLAARRGGDPRGDAELASWPMDLLLKKLLPTGDLTLLVDLSAARAASWKGNADWLDVWPAGKTSWRLLCDSPLALGLSVQAAEEHRCELGLVCSGETMAEKLRLEMQKLLTAALRALPDHIAELKTAAPANVQADAADDYRKLLDELLASLHTYGCETSDGIVWLRLNWSGRDLPSWAAAALNCDAAWKADRLAAALAADKANQRGLLEALLNYSRRQKPEQFPAGAAPGVRTLGPESRLSWITEMLPFLGHDDWPLNPVFDWNGGENKETARRPLPEVINPALGPATAGEYPVTQYVGVAGVGEDAAGLPAGDPRAGMFGYERQTRPQDLVRGGANTIAVMGVQERTGPWAQGGRSTVRALTQQPYINGPDGFGSSQPGGMVVGMADGSVRFISKDVDPQVMEQLVTVRGGEKVDMARLDPQLPNPAQRPAVPQQPVKPQPPAPKPPRVATRPKVTVPLDPKVQQRLSEPLRKISIDNMTFGGAARLVGSIGALQVSFDPDAMQELGVSFDDPVKIEAEGATVAALLDKIAEARGMARVVENNQVLFTSKPAYREELRTTPYTVFDLTGGDAKSAAELARLLERFVEPDSWQAAGGQGTIEVAPDVLRIAQTGHVHHQIIVFCEKLRVARGLPPKSHMDPKSFSLETRIARAKPILGHVATLNIGTATPLSEILQQLKQPAGTEILIDRPALAEAGVSENAPTKLRSENLPQGVVLHQLLDPLDLAWRAVDANTLQVTSKKALAARLEIEFYPVVKRLKGQPAAALIEQVKAAVPDASWGEGGAAGAIEFDPASQCLIVLQTQPVQAVIEAFLAK